MANFLPLFLVIGLVPLGFLVVALYSNYRSKKRMSAQNPPPTSSRSITSRLREYLSPSHWCTQHKRNATNESEDLEMKCIGVAVPDNASLHRAAALERLCGSDLRHNSERSPNALERQLDAHGGASLTRASPSIASGSTSTMYHSPRPSAPSPPPSNASAGHICAQPTRTNWWQNAAEDSDDEEVVPAFRRERAVPGKQSVFRAPPSTAARVPERRGDAGGLMEVSLR